MLAERRPRILIVEDEAKTASTVALYLRNAGMEVAVASDGRTGLDQARAGGFDLLILDVMLPGIDGREICRAVRAESPVPILLVTARTAEEDRIEGLELGADDYVAKPFSPRELVARVRANLRRVRPARAGQVLSVGDLTLDPEAHRVHRAGAELHLGPTEFRLMSALMEKPGRVWTREALLDRVWGRDIYVDTRTVDVHIGRLRKALMAKGGEDPIRTVRGAGYSLD